MDIIEKTKSLVERHLSDVTIERFEKLLRSKSYLLKNEIKNYFLALNKDEIEPEIAEIINYFEKYRFSIYPYEYQRNYHTKDITVYYDKAVKMLYVLHNNKRLYFPQYMGKEMVRRYYNLLRKEQDENSPHRYETNDFTVKDGDIIADIGAAEGIWALDNVEKAGKIYLFECNDKWVKALKRTFEPWKEKVFIVNKYVSNINREEYITLDDFFEGETIDFIKADIEGMEINLLEGSKELLKRETNLKLLLCTYHRKNDAESIKKTLEAKGYKIEYSKRYMIFIIDKELDEPYIRRGIIRASKNANP